MCRLRQLSHRPENESVPVRWVRRKGIGSLTPETTNPISAAVPQHSTGHVLVVVGVCVMLVCWGVKDRPAAEMLGPGCRGLVSVLHVFLAHSPLDKTQLGLRSRFHLMSKLGGKNPYHVLSVSLIDQTQCISAMLRSSHLKWGWRHYKRTVLPSSVLNWSFWDTLKYFLLFYLPCI